MATQVVDKLDSTQLGDLVDYWPGALLTGLLIGLYWSTVPGMVVDWWTYDGYSYGFLIPPLAAYLAWTRREQVRRQPAVRDSRGLLLLGAGCLIYLLGELGVEYFLSRISLVIVLSGLIWTLWGFPRLKALRFPLVLLASMVP